MLGVVEVTMKWFANNAVFEPPAMDNETCPKYWWRNLLYINTLFPVEQMVRGYVTITLYRVIDFLFCLAHHAMASDEVIFLFRVYSAINVHTDGFVMCRKRPTSN